MNYGSRNRWQDQGGEGVGEAVDEEGWRGAAGGSGKSNGKGVASSEGVDGESRWVEGRG